MYRIVEVPQYYQNTLGAPNASFLRDGGQIIEFETREEATAEANRRYASNFDENGYFDLEHGEYSPTQYEVFDIEEYADDPDCVDASREHFNGYSLIPVEDVPEDIIDAFAADENGVEPEEGHYDGLTQLFTLEKTGNDGRDYIMAYRVSVLALDAVDGDLSNLNWTNESYYRSV